MGCKVRFCENFFAGCKVHFCETDDLCEKYFIFYKMKLQIFVFSQCLKDSDRDFISGKEILEYFSSVQSGISLDREIAAATRREPLRDAATQ